MTQKQIRAGLTQSGQYQTNVAVDVSNKWYQSPDGYAAMGQAWMSPGKGRALKDSG